MKSLSYLMDQILYEICKKKHSQKSNDISNNNSNNNNNNNNNNNSNDNKNNPSIKIYVNKIENRIAFNIKTGYYLVLLI